VNINKDQYYVVRVDRGGVFVAKITRIDEATKVADLEDALRVHYWYHATECIGIALFGVGSNSRLTSRVPSMTVFGVIEVIPVTDAALARIREVPTWKA
jgi:hypothetical protein